MAHDVTVTPRPPRLSERFGPVGGLVKRVVERLIRFAIVRQNQVNLDLDERLRNLEAAPVSQRGGDVELRAQCAALSARLTHVQREVASLRERLGRAEAQVARLSLNADTADGADAAKGADADEAATIDRGVERSS